MTLVIDTVFLQFPLFLFRYIYAALLVPVSDRFTALYQKHHKAILDHLQDHLLHSHPGYLKGHWPVPANVYLVLASFYQMCIDNPSDRHYGLQSCHDITPLHFQDKQFNDVIDDPLEAHLVTSCTYQHL